MRAPLIRSLATGLALAAAVPLSALPLDPIPPAWAATVPPSAVERAALARFNTLDVNGDGEVSHSELAPLGRRRAADALFALLDLRGNGKIRLADVARRGNSALLARFRAYDAAHRGVVTRRDFPNFVDPALFAALDTNHDGRLSLAELRPEFAGSRAAAPAAPPSPAPHRTAPAQTAMLCWVPIVNAHGVWGQGPGIYIPCRP